MCSIAVVRAVLI